MENTKFTIIGQVPERNITGPPGRTRLEKIFIVIIVILFIGLIALAVTLGIREMQRHSGLKDYCLTKECLSAASDLLSSRNTAIDPCENFYNYTCENWIKNSIYQDGMMDRLSSFDDDMNLKLKALLSPEELSDDEPLYFQKAHQFYQTCMNVDERHTSYASLVDDLEWLGGYPVMSQAMWNPDAFHYLTLMRRMNDRGLDEGVFVSFATTVDYKNNSITRVVVSQTSLGLQLEQFPVKHMVNLYSNLISGEASYLCQNSASVCRKRDTGDISEELSHAIEIERKLASISRPAYELQDKEVIYNMMTIAKLQRDAPGVDWLSMFRLYFPTITANSEVMVTSPEFMKNFAEIMAETMRTREGKRNLANYVMYRIIKEMAQQLNKPMRELNHEFSAATTGAEEPPLWEECLRLTTSFFDLSLAAVYVKKILPAGRKAAMKEMMENIRAELKEILLKTHWMDKETRREALVKLEKIYPVALYPDDLMDEDKLNMWYEKLSVGKDHYQNYKNAEIFMRDIILGGFGVATDRTSWTHLPGRLLEAQASYYPNNNTIFVPIGIAQDWFFEEDNPKYINYGRIGYVIAHEFGHAFDRDGADYDENGNLRNWWKEETKKQFKKSSKCMVDLFDQYFVPDGNRTINGTLTLTENVADDLGLAETYKAFVKASAKDPDPLLPGVDLNRNQLFWLNTAAVWCGRQPPKMMVRLLESDPHSPIFFRVHSALRNNADFIRDFNCKLGSGMNPTADKCHVWGVG